MCFPGQYYSKFWNIVYSMIFAFLMKAEAIRVTSKGFCQCPSLNENFFPFWTFFKGFGTLCNYCLATIPVCLTKVVLVDSCIFVQFLAWDVASENGSRRSIPPFEFQKRATSRETLCARCALSFSWHRYCMLPLMLAVDTTAVPAAFFRRRRSVSRGFFGSDPSLGCQISAQGRPKNIFSNSIFEERCQELRTLTGC